MLKKYYTLTKINREYHLIAYRHRKCRRIEVGAGHNYSRSRFLVNWNFFWHSPGITKSPHILHTLPKDLFLLEFGILFFSYFVFFVRKYCYRRRLSALRFCGGGMFSTAVFEKFSTKYISYLPFKQSSRVVR